MNATVEEMTEKERHAKRKLEHARIRELRGDEKRCLEVGRDLAAKKKRVTELDVVIEKAILIGEPYAELEAERTRITASLKDLGRAWTTLSRAQSEISYCQSRLRNELANPALRIELKIAKSSVRWADERRNAAQKELQSGAAEVIWQAELEHAAHLLDEAALEVERLRKLIIDE